jgi:hypothetical protein
LATLDKGLKKRVDNTLIVISDKRHVRIVNWHRGKKEFSEKFCKRKL